MINYQGHSWMITVEYRYQLSPWTVHPQNGSAGRCQSSILDQSWAGIVQGRNAQHQIHGSPPNNHELIRQFTGPTSWSFVVCWRTLRPGGAFHGTPSGYQTVSWLMKGHCWKMIIKLVDCRSCCGLLYCSKLKAESRSVLINRRWHWPASNWWQALPLLIFWVSANEPVLLRVEIDHHF